MAGFTVGFPVVHFDGGLVFEPPIQEGHGKPVHFSIHMRFKLSLMPITRNRMCVIKPSDTAAKRSYEKKSTMLAEPSRMRAMKFQLSTLP